MRKRDEIEGETVAWGNSRYGDVDWKTSCILLNQALIIEVLLDIRDLMQGKEDDKNRA